MSEFRLYEGLGRGSTGGYSHYIRESDIEQALENNSFILKKSADALGISVEELKRKSTELNIPLIRDQLKK